MCYLTCSTVYLMFLIGFHILVFFTDLCLIECLAKFLALFLNFSVMVVSFSVRLESFSKRVRLMLEVHNKIIRLHYWP